ncbi:hypothetical protein MFIFM68171_08106 [Madurella fahalii]|uniref:Uncharacterized protein n=1 Tax=Madurella fahalii TaxID=1157608 RepID=A0ABQ0GJE8_9PEZI
MADQNGDGIQAEMNLFTRTSELAIDPFSTELGSTLSTSAQDITDSSNHFSGAKTGSWQVTGDVMAIRPVTYECRNAILLAFRFQYSWDIGATDRIIRADIEISFGPARRDSADRPVVVKYEPSGRIAVNATDTRVVKVIETEATGSVTSGQQPLQIQPGARTVRRTERSFNKTDAVSVLGGSKRSRDAMRMNAPIDTALWIIKENEALNQGIPREINVAVVVEPMANTLLAVVKTTVQTSFGVGRFALLWPKKSPLRIAVGDQTAFGPIPRSGKVEEWEEHDWSPFAGVANV